MGTSDRRRKFYYILVIRRVYPNTLAKVQSITISGFSNRLLSLYMYGFTLHAIASGTIDDFGENPSTLSVVPNRVMYCAGVGADSVPPQILSPRT